MSGPSPAGSPETLEQGRAPRAPHPHRHRRLVVLGVVLLLLAGTGLVLDRRARGREAPLVDACASGALDAVSFANNRVDAIAGYVRPALLSRTGASLRRRLLVTVSAAVRPTVPQLRRAREDCARTRVLRWHDGLHARRRDCLLLLDADLAFVTGVVRDGARAYIERSLPAGRCTVPPTG